MTTDLSEDSIRAALRSHIGSPMRYLDEVGSTNTEALSWARDGAPEGALVVTNHQTKGRGRWTRTWSSTPGALLQFSLVLRPRLELDHLGLVTTALGVSCAEAIEKTTGLNATLKWPNDVRIGGKKVAGILVETHLTGPSLDVAVAGMGVNVAWSRAEIPEELREVATSLASELEPRQPPSRADLLAEILIAFEERYALLSRDASSVIEDATRRSDVLGREVVIALSSDRTVEGRATRLLDDGRLEVDTLHGLVAVGVGEIRQLR